MPDGIGVDMKDVLRHNGVDFKIVKTPTLGIDVIVVNGISTKELTRLWKLAKDEQQLKCLTE